MSHQGGQIHADINNVYILNPKNLRLSARGGLICVQKGNSYAMNLRTKALEVLIAIFNLYLIEIKDSGKQIYTSRQRKSTKYLMTSLLIGSFSDGQDDNLRLLNISTLGC